jgi:hypothetical protein
MIFDIVPYFGSFLTHHSSILRGLFDLVFYRLKFKLDSRHHRAASPSSHRPTPPLCLGRAASHRSGEQMGAAVAAVDVAFMIVCPLLIVVVLPINCSSKATRLSILFDSG